MENISVFSLQEKLILVTGSGRGNGEAIAIGLARLGAKIIVTDIDPASVSSTVQAIRLQGGEAWGFVLDVSRSEDCDRLASTISQEIGDIDVLVNNAGILQRLPFDAQDANASLLATLAVNVHGPFFMAKAFLAALKRRSGNIVNVASIQSFVAALTSAAYATSKGAVAQMTRTLAAELAPHGIRVNAIAPGLIETPMAARTINNETSMAVFMQHVPMKRTAKPEELVGPVAFLASPAASYVTGVVMPVDGGYLTT